MQQHEYVVKDQDKGQINPKTTSLLELCDAVQEKWEEDLTVSRIYVVAHRGNTMESFKQGIPDNSIPNIPSRYRGRRGYGGT